MTPGRADTGALPGQKVVHFVHLTRWAVDRVMKMDGEQRHHCGEIVPAAALRACISYCGAAPPPAAPSAGTVRSTGLKHHLKH